MFESLKKSLLQIRTFYGELPLSKKVASLALLSAILFGVGYSLMWAGRESYQPLMSNLNTEDATNIIRVLRDKKIPFKLDQDGKAISIPPESVYDLRLELATMGYPQSSVVGYEVFDKQSLGTTSFVQKVNQKRALEGELTRSITSIKGVKRARLHLALPQKSAFVEDQKKSSASVFVDLEPGIQLNDKQIFGIGNLVARAVEGMDINDVVVVDSQGRVLSKNMADPVAQQTATQLDHKLKVEHEYEQRIEDILSHVVGEGKVVAKVTAEMDFSRSNETETTYDPDGTALRSSEKQNITAEGVRPGPSGPPGAASNTPGETPKETPIIKNVTSNGREIINNEVPKKVRSTANQVGVVKKISVAVVLDGKPVMSKAEEGRAPAQTTEAWSPEKLKEFETLVASAVGIDKKRGDSLEIRNMEFAQHDFEAAQRFIAEQEKRSFMRNLVLYSVVGLTILLFFLFAVRPFIRWMIENTGDSVESFLPQTIEELERLQKSGQLTQIEAAVPEEPEMVDPDKVAGEMIKEKIVTMVDSNPHKAALVIRDWMHDAQAAKKQEDDKGKAAAAPA